MSLISTLPLPQRLSDVVSVTQSGFTPPQLQLKSTSLSVPYRIVLSGLKDSARDQAQTHYEPPRLSLVTKEQRCWDRGQLEGFLGQRSSVQLANVSEPSGRGQKA